MIKILFIFSIIIFFTLTPYQINAAPDEDFVRAENTFKFQDYKNAAEILETLLYPENKLTDEELYIKAREYLGACYFWLKNENRMNEEFTSLLTQNSAYELDPFYYPAPLIEKFNALQKRLITLKIIKDKSEKTIKKKNKIKSSDSSNITPIIQKEQILMQKNYYMLNFAPFGFGQFQNGQKAMGTIFLTGQILSLATNIGSYFGMELLRGEDGKFKSNDINKAKNLRTSQYVSLGIFGALYLWSVIDALIYYEPVQIISKENTNEDINIIEKKDIITQPASYNDAGAGFNPASVFLQYRWFF